MSAELLNYSHNKNLFAKINLDGTSVSQNGDDTQTYYGTRQNFEFGYLSSATQGISWTQTGPTISIDQHGIVSWNGALILQSATNLPGPFLDVDTASNPFTNTVSHPRQFFRLRTG